ncbi:putative multi-domain containing protein [Aduncisulcus paluster]|uniref:Protein-S-isoprenylcysteine O-methyltransferase n=1 Tax=Aduncisulcus paluster TaxID=2918883 RepID=A0ABQ5KII1_9EUKA|nr:putative multi-domain containing protein [Aduncisulcus paluster]
MVPIYWFCGFVLFFHISEALLALVQMADKFSIGSLLISVPYLIAMAVGLTEYFVEAYFFPQMKPRIVMFIGIAVTTFGEFFRKAAILTNKTFTHMIRTHKTTSHKLCKKGVYSFSRHPSYFGWFWYAVGTQIILCNPFSILAFAFVEYIFFRDRIRYEESLLVIFFGDEYIQYKKDVPTRIPFIK